MTVWQVAAVYFMVGACVIYRGSSNISEEGWAEINVYPNWIVLIGFTFLVIGWPAATLIKFLDRKK